MTSEAQADGPLVSIVTPVLNGASTVGQCLASVAAQTYPTVEHIVVDGGSTDGTLDIVHRFAERRPIRWISEPDRGLYDAVNKGLGMARGDVLAYLNADDAYFPWSVEVAVEALGSGFDFAYGDLGVLRGENKSRFMPHFYPRFDLNVYAYFSRLAQPTVFWRRSAFEALGPFDDSYPLIGDCEFWLRAGAKGLSFRHVGDVLAIQHDHGATLRNKHRAQLVKEFERLRSSYREAAGPPARWGRLKAALGWRGRTLWFYGNLLRRRPRRWTRFISWLKQNEIRAHQGVLMCLLPASKWPRTMSFADAARLDRALQATLARGPDHFPSLESRGDD